MDSKDAARTGRLSLQSKKRLTDIMYEEALAACDEKVKAFAQCAKVSGMLVVFKCREENTAMNKCIREHMTQAELDHRTASEIERQKNDAEFQEALKKPPVYGK